MSSYDKFAKIYADSHGEEGDYFHKTQIDPCIYESVGNPKGKIIYDLGCGNGYISRNLARKGAKVFAADLSSGLIKIAQEKSQNLDITYSVRDGTDFSGFNDGQFDIVAMNMVIHYIKDLDKLFSGISRVLKPGGKVVFSLNHFLRPTYPYSEWTKRYLVEMNGTLWLKDEDYVLKNKNVKAEERLFVMVSNYLKDYLVKAISGWDKKTILTIYNRPLSRFVNTMSKYNLFIDKFYEPESVEFPKTFPEKLRKNHHIPTFIIIGAFKK